MRSLASCGLSLLLFLQMSGPVLSQERPLLVVSAGPTGEVGQADDANEIRVVFSEPMVALGGPATVKPEWLTVSPAIRANYLWSGTRTLIATVDPEQRLPNATRFTVRVGGEARSVSGRALNAPYSFSFVTPTVRLIRTDWYRKTGQADSPTMIALRFNQPVRPADVLAHASVRHEAHPWTAPTMSAAARERLERDDPAGLKLFDAKVARIAGVTTSSDPVRATVATTWDEGRFPRTPDRVVLETTSVPSTDAWLRISFDNQLPSPDGPERPPVQSTTIRLDPTFFVDQPRCTRECTPGFFAIGFRRGVAPEDAAKVLSIREWAEGRAEAPVERSAEAVKLPYSIASGWTSIEPRWMGFPQQPPASSWVMRIESSLTAADGQVLGYPWLEIVSNLHHVPYADWTGSVWESGNGPVVPVMSRNVLQVDEWMAPMRAADIMRRLLDMRQRGSVQTPPVRPLSRRFGGTPDLFEAHGVDLRSSLAPSGTGLVWAAIHPTALLPGSARSFFDQPRAALVQVTNLGLTVKDSPQSTLVFVTRLDNAQAVAGARVSIVNTAGVTVWAGVTGPDGVAMAPALPLRERRTMYQLTHVVTAEKDGDLAWVASDWTGDVGPWSFSGIPYGLAEASEVLRGSVFTDRGVYTRGEDVHVKTVLRSDAPSGIRMLAPGTKVSVSVVDARGSRLERRFVEVNRWGGADFTVRVPEGAPLGRYQIETIRASSLDANDQTTEEFVSGSFLVAAFRRPDFRVDATLTAAPPVLGTTLSVSADAKYLFGAPIGPQPVRWFVNKFATHAVPPAILKRYAENQFAFGYRTESAERAPWQELVQKNETLDRDGRVRASVPTASGEDFASTIRFEAEVSNASGQRIANRADVVLHPASFYVGLGRPPFFVDIRRGLATSVIAAELAGTPRANVGVTLSLWREQWVSERRPENPASEVWTRKELPAGEWKVTTAIEPVRLPIPLKDGGCYILRATARDEAGRPTRTDVRFYALGGGASSWRTQGNKIELTPERVSWTPGETARVLVHSPWPRATAVVTKEREGVKSYQRVEITSTQDAVEIPITEADVPNVYVSVVLAKGRTVDGAAGEDDPGKPAFRLGYTELLVDDDSKRLAVTVTADREEYRPRGNVRVSVAVADRAKRPRESEVTLWAVDHGLLSLTDYKAPDVARAVYAKKQLQVSTQDNRLRLIGRQTLVSTAEAEQAKRTLGAGGRGGAMGVDFSSQGQMGFAARASTVMGLGESIINVSTAAVSSDLEQESAELRTDFRPVVFWLGSIVTGPDGRATTSVTLPDSLTTYRIMAVAGDLASHFGADDTEIRATKPLTMLPSFPRFLSRGDRATFGAIVTNNTSRAGDAVVTIRSLDGELLTSEGGSTRTIRLAPGQSENVRFSLTARDTGRARVRMNVTLGAETDAFEVPLAITAPIVLETVAAYGDTITSATEKLSLPAGILANRGGLTVSLAPTALVGLGESARYLEEYPYTCAEQQASRALALLLSSDLGGAFSMKSVKPEELRASGMRLLNELYSYQCGDGGFGMFQGACYGPSSTYLTSYILDVLHRAEALNVPANRGSVERALSFLQSQLRQPPPEMNWWPAWAASQGYALKVLSSYGRNVRDDVTRLYATADRMPVFALSYLADALAAQGDRGTRYTEVLRRMTNAIRIDADRAHVQERDEAALVWLWNSNVRATAVVLDGLARRNDDATFVSPLVRWLLAVRENGRWGTTQENAVALGALVNYYKRFESDVPNLTTTVTLGGRELGGAAFVGRTTTAHDVRLTMPELVRSISTGAQDLVVARTGTGRVFYTARLQYASATPPAAATTDRGIRVERRYQRFTADDLGESATTFAAGDLVRVTLTVTIPHEGRFLAFSDPLPAGFEAVDGTLKTTASDLAAASTTQSVATDRFAWWRRGGFDHVEKHDDKVMAFATRLAAGRHEFTYLARATTAGTFSAAGTFGEAMYAPEITGRGAAATITVK